MFSIRKSKGNCEYCPLYDAPSCICETNSEDDLSQVRVLFIAENPGKNEVEQERPLVGVAGQVFRDPFNKFILPTGVKYLITNAVLCATITEDGKTVNPDSKVIECCKPNVDFFIEICKPDLIVAMGQTIASVLGICETGITKFRSQFYKYKDYDVFLTVHPSYVNRNRSKELEPFRKDFITIARYLGIYEEKVQQPTISKGKAYYYKIPERFYTEDYSLIDVQTNRADGSLIYIFRDKDNKKEIFKVQNAVSEYYYYYNPDPRGKLIEPYQKLSVKKCNYNEKFNLDSRTTYEGDLTLADKHAIDYYLQRKADIKPSNLNKLFVDIEVYTGKSRVFPQPKFAEYPVSSISMKYNEDEIVSLVLLDKKTHYEDIEIENVTFFDSEEKLLSEFINLLRKYDPDVITGWNFKYFDMMYLANRIKRLRMNYNRLSPFHYVVIDNFNFQVTGYVILDMLDLYKMFTYTGRESYTLDFISRLELGDEKVKYEFRDLNQLYEEDIKLFVEYNRKDVELVYELDKKLDHINFLNTVRESVHCCWKSAQTTMGQIDAMITSHLKQRGLSVKNSQSQVKQEFAGAYVLQPEAGIYDYLIDLDFSSLYPNLIRTYNIGPNTLVAKVDESVAIDFIYRKKVPEQVKIVKDPIYNDLPTEMSRDQFLELVKDKIVNITGCIYKRHEDEISIFSEVLGFHIDRRKEYKTLMKEAIRESDQEKRKYYHTRQLAEKILVNASYGVLGNEKFRLFNVNLASSITSSGREAVRASAYAGTKYLVSDDKVEEIPLVTEEDLEKCKKECLVYMDTDSCFFDMSRWLQSKDPNTTPNEAKDKILEKVRDLEDFLNKDFLTRFVKMHNINPEFSFLDLKQEVFAKRALFPGTKKKYALFITNREGEDVRELEIKGLDVRRSDYPAYTKQALQELLELILYNDDVNISDILNFQKMYSDEITKKIKNGDLDVCKPVSYSKPISSYKRVPPHVEAMEWWNQIEYDYFVPGTRGYLYKLQGVDITLMPGKVKDRYQSLLSKIGKNSIDKIVVPIEQPSLPKYYVPDVKAMLDFAWTDRCSLLTGNLVQSVESSLLRF